MKASMLVVLAPGFLTLVAAQRNNNGGGQFDSLVSEAFSAFTQASSISASSVTETSAAAASSSSAIETTTTSNSQSLTAPETSGSASESTSTPISISSESPASPAASTRSQASSSISSHASYAASASNPPSPSTSVLGAASETGAASASSSGPSHDSNLPIILGSVLGALGLGLVIFAVLLCRRRRQRNQSPRNGALSPADDEVGDESPPSAPTGGEDPSNRGLGVVGASPSMAEHPALRENGEPENPFVPIPPPPRRTAPHSRGVSTDGVVPGDEAFLTKKEAARPPSSPSNMSHNSSHQGAPAAGLVGAAAGAALMHQSNRESNGSLVSNERSRHEPESQRQINRKPVPVNHVNNSEPWPYSPVSPIDQTAKAPATSGSPSQSSDESHRSFRDATRANEAFDQGHAPKDGDNGRGHVLATGAVGVATGAIGGAPLTRHYNRPRSEGSSSGYSHRTSRSPRRLSYMTSGDGSEPSNSSRTSIISQPYRDSVPSYPPSPKSRPNSTPSAFPSSRTERNLHEIPPIPTTPSRRNSALGPAAPTTTTFSYVNRPSVPSPLSGEIRNDFPYPPPRSAGGMPRGSGMMSQNPRRRSAGTRYTPDHIYESYGTPGDYIHDGMGPVKGIVGDNGYPHLGIPRRRSGGEYGMGSTTGMLGPQMLAPPEALASEDQTTRTSTMVSDHSSWRLSSGIPGSRQADRGNMNSPRSSGSHMPDSVANEKRRTWASDVAGSEKGPSQRPGLGEGL
ncbi:uncharacterized protein Z518_05506 [Rhinocladiella mackenziei CBS 650.93]|uniref:Uncharacterized protein n=1 Tax=Rhinocladiella mackenziei CBS 650.93 TaxID=1442369 RepID=A0A0D2IND0_9EURO|nr:uncharacterized protein Z518_05506 [Rhinocladiella mackenziei CBS 650.93]KIX04636.1 hypothetical protein Z518_05506 [Rhinocladiella mackenziei CBS 650.93]